MISNEVEFYMVFNIKYGDNENDYIFKGKIE